MIGDQPGTDGRLAERLGIPFGLVDSGVTPAGRDGFDVPVGHPVPGSRCPWSERPGLTDRVEKVLAGSEHVPGRVNNMVDKDAFQRYLDAGIAFTNMTRAKAEELVQELVQSGEFQSGDARAKVDELIERSRKGREAFVAQVRQRGGPPAGGRGHHQSRGPGQAGGRPARRTADAGRAATGTKGRRPARSRRQEGRGQEGPGQEGAGKKAAAKKSPAKKAAAQEGGGQEVAGEEGGGQEGPAKKSPTATAAGRRHRRAGRRSGSAD